MELYLDKDVLGLVPSFVFLFFVGTREHQIETSGKLMQGHCGVSLFFSLVSMVSFVIHSIWSNRLKCVVGQFYCVQTQFTVSMHIKCCYFNWFSISSGLTLQ